MRGPALVTLELLLDKELLERELIDTTLLEETLATLDEEGEVAIELDERIDELDERTDDDELVAAELVVAELDVTPQPATTPNGEGCAAQVAVEIQLLPFS